MVSYKFMSFDFFLTALQDYHIGQNTAYDYLVAALIFIGFLVALKLFQVIILAKLNSLAKKTETDIDDIAIEIFKKIKPPFYFFVAIYFAVKVLIFPEIVNTIIVFIFTIAIVYEIIRAIERIIEYVIQRYLNKTKESAKDKKHTEQMLKSLKLVARIFLWLIGITMILGNLGVDITSLIAGLGIGGIAIALALQNVLTDLFASFSIYLDKPFQVGDFIISGTDSGTVEKIGFKTTRIRTIQGEELVVSNKELTEARVQNFRKLEERRHDFYVGVLYETSQEKLEMIPKIVEKIIQDTKMAKFNHCYFDNFGDFSLNFKISFYVESDEFPEFAATKEKINLEIFKQFAEQGIEFSYPTQTVILNK